MQTITIHPGYEGYEWTIERYGMRYHDKLGVMQDL